MLPLRYLGAFLGAAMVYLLFSPVIDHYNELHHLSRGVDGGRRGSVLHASGSCHHAAPCVRRRDRAHRHPGPRHVRHHGGIQHARAGRQCRGALLIGLLVATIGACAGYLEAWPINPARDFGPRLFCYFTGWGAQALPAPQNYWWVPIAGPLLGGDRRRRSLPGGDSAVSCPRAARRRRGSEGSKP